MRSSATFWAALALLGTLNYTAAKSAEIHLSEGSKVAGIITCSSPDYLLETSRVMAKPGANQAEIDEVSERAFESGDCVRHAFPIIVELTMKISSTLLSEKDFDRPFSVFRARPIGDAGSPDVFVLVQTGPRVKATSA